MQRAAVRFVYCNGAVRRGGQARLMAPRSKPGGGKTKAHRILIVDDEPQIRELLRATLTNRLPSAQIHEAHTVLMAVALLETNQFDLIVTDLAIGQDRGFDLVRHVKSRLDVPVVVFTGQDADEAAAAVTEAGADSMVQKSADGLRHLVVIVCALLGGA